MSISTAFVPRIVTSLSDKSGSATTMGWMQYFSSIAVLWIQSSQWYGPRSSYPLMVVPVCPRLLLDIPGSHGDVGFRRVKNGFGCFLAPRLAHLGLSLHGLKKRLTGGLGFGLGDFQGSRLLDHLSRALLLFLLRGIEMG